MIKKLFSLVLAVIVLFASIGYCQEQVIIKKEYYKFEYIDDKTANNKEYFAWALIGSAYTDARWRIMRISYTGNDFVIQYADGDTEFNNVIANYPTLTYS